MYTTHEAEEKKKKVKLTSTKQHDSFYKNDRAEKTT